VKADVAIVGGGIMGSALAYWLTRLDPNVRVVVIERDPTYSTGFLRAVGRVHPAAVYDPGQYFEFRRRASASCGRRMNCWKLPGPRSTSV